MLNSDNQNNLYDILEIDNFSSKEQIKKAWKKLALKYHPDKNYDVKNCIKKNFEIRDKFLKIKYAYDILSNDELKTEYDKNLNNMINTSNNFYFNFDPFDADLKNKLKQFIESSEIDTMLKLIIRKKKIENLFIFENSYPTNSNDFIKKILDIDITIDYDLRDVWNLVFKNVKYHRLTKGTFEEVIYPFDFVQIYENEGEKITIGNKTYNGDLKIHINIINTNYSDENYFIFNNDLYMIINSKRISDGKFKIKFLNNIKYKFNLNNLIKINGQLGEVYYKKKFGLAKIDEKCTSNNELQISYGNLFFIVVI